MFLKEFCTKNVTIRNKLRHIASPKRWHFLFRKDTPSIFMITKLAHELSANLLAIPIIRLCIIHTPMWRRGAFVRHNHGLLGHARLGEVTAMPIPANNCLSGEM